MGWLGRLIGREPPRVPAGCRAAVVMDGALWHVGALDAGDQERKKLSPSFERQTSAYAYLDWIEGRAKRFEYPPGAA